MAPTTPMAQNPTLVTPASAHLAPAARVYVARLFQGGQAHKLGFRTLALSSSTYDGKDAWLLLESRRIGNEELADSLFVSKATLAPLHRIAHAEDAVVTTHYASDSIVTIFDTDSGKTRVAVPGESNLIGNINWLEPLLASLPLANGWKGSATTVFVGPTDHAKVVLELEVVGEENLFIPDGHYDCWVMNLQVGGTQEHLWVRKSDRLLVKQDTPVAGIAAAKVQLILAEGQTPKELLIK